MNSKIFPRQPALSIILIIIAMCFPLSMAYAQSSPVLHVVPETIPFYAYFCDDTLMPQNPLVRGFMVANIGGGDMTWSGAADADWVIFEPLQGGNFDSVTVWIDWTMVSPPFAPPQPGDTIYYESIITIEAEGAENSPQFVTVLLGFFCPSDEFEIIVEPDFFDITLPTEATYSDWLYVTEAGGAIVMFSYSNNSNWLMLPETFAPVYTPDSVQLGISTEGLEPGIYVDSILIMAGGGELLFYQAIPVQLTVSDEAFMLGVIPEAYNFVVPPGQPIIGESLYVYEVNDRSLSFVTYNQNYWLYIDTMAASPLYTPELLLVNIFADTLFPGIFHDTILIYAEEAINSPLAVPVSLRIEEESPEYEIATTPRYFSFTLPQNTQADDAFSIYEVHGHSVPFIVTEISPWMQITNISGPFTPAEVSFSISTADLSPGIYADTFFIFPDTDGVSFAPEAVAVFLEVQGDMAVVIAEPDYFSFILNPGEFLLENRISVYEAQGDNITFATQTLHGSQWLRLYYDSLETPITPGTVLFDIYTEGLSPGTYVDTIVVFYPLDDIYGFDDVIIPVVLTVNGDPPDYVLQAMPSSFSFHLQPGESGFDSLFVYEAFDRMIGFQYYNSAFWLVVNPLGMPPFVTPMSMPIAVSANQLEPGSYVDTIFLSTDYESGFPQTFAVPVFLTVGGPYMSGDANGDQELNIGDALFIVNYIFRDGPAPEPLEAGDVDCSGEINVGDVVNIILYIFRDGPELGCP